MLRLSRRIEALEQGSSRGAFKPWHLIMSEDGQTQEEAIAAYEAEHGAIGEDGAFIVRFVD